MFSGLAWNLKSTITDEIHKHYPNVIRLIQTNKDYLRQNPNATPEELFEQFLKTNQEEVISKLKDDSIVITDRSPFDWFIYDLMMSPVHQWELPNLLHPRNDSDVNQYLRINEICNKMLKYFNSKFVVSLTNQSDHFIKSIFEKQPYSSTSYLFDNVDKYREYSTIFNTLSNRLFNTIYSVDKNYHHESFTITETTKPEDFVLTVSNKVYEYIQ